MKINYIKQSSVFGNIQPDIFFCSSGYEKRSTYFLEQYKENFINSKNICFQFEDRKVHSRSRNDSIFRENNFSFVPINSILIEDLIQIVAAIIEEDVKSSLVIVVDFSSMTMMIYAALLKYLASYCESFLEVTVYFNYSPAIYTPPILIESLSVNQPISIFDNLQTTDKKIALLVGLGYEKDKAIGLFEYFQNDRDDVYLFLSKNYQSDPFYSKAIENNKEILNLIDDNNIIKYSLSNVQQLISTLDTLVSYLLSNDKRVVIIPIGPKQFTLISLLISIIHSEVTTYRISHGIKSPAVDKQADTKRENIITVVNFI